MNVAPTTPRSTSAFPTAALVAALVALAGLPACSFSDSVSDSVSEPGPLPDAREGGLLRTDRDLYVAAVVRDGGGWDHVAFDVPFVVRNPTDRPIYVVGCNGPHPPVLEKLEGGRWRGAWGAVVQTCGPEGYPVPPHGERRDTVRVEGFFPGQNVVPTFNTSVPGTYRLRTPVYGGFDGPPAYVPRDPLPAERGVSNAFEVRVK